MNLQSLSGCLIVLTVVGVIVKLVLDDIGRGDTCPHCSALLVVPLRITGEER